MYSTVGADSISARFGKPLIFKNNFKGRFFVRI